LSGGFVVLSSPAAVFPFSFSLSDLLMVIAPSGGFFGGGSVYRESILILFLPFSPQPLAKSPLLDDQGQNLEWTKGKGEKSLGPQESVAILVI